jgi:hypothetical protein
MKTINTDKKTPGSLSPGEREKITIIKELNKVKLIF